MNQRELRERLPDLKDWELDKLEEWYRQTGDDSKRRMIRRERKKRRG